METASRPLLCRLAVIDRLLRSGEYPNAPRLAGELEVTVRTIYRDLDVFRYTLGAPLAFCHKHNGFYYTDADYSLPLFRLTEGELAALFLAERLLQTYRTGYAEKETLDLQNVQINAGAVPAIVDAAIHVSGYLGDSIRDLMYTGLDAQRISRVVVGLDPGFGQWVLADPIIVADVSNDNQLSSLDALRVAQEAVGYDRPEMPPITGVTPAVVGPDPMLSVGTRSAEHGAQSAERGAQSAGGEDAGMVRSALSAPRSASVVVPIMLDCSDGLASVNLYIAYDTSRLEVVSAADVQRGSLLSQLGSDSNGKPWTFDSFAVRLDKEAGVIYISGYRSAGPITGLGAGSLATIEFRVRSDAPAGPAVINLLQNAGSAQTALGGTDALGNDFLFDLQPRPSNEAGDVLDGRIDVVGSLR